MSSSFRELHPNIKLRIGIGFVQRFLGVMLMPLMAIHLADLYGAATAGILVLAVAAAGIVAAFLGGHLADIHGRLPLLISGELGAALTFAVLALANSPWWQSGPVTFLAFLFNICLSNLAQPAGDAMVIDVSTPENRLLVYTIDYWSINLAFTVGALVGGFLYGDHFAELLAGGALLSIVTATVIWKWMAESAPESAKEAATGVAAMLRGYLTVARDRTFFRLLAAAVLTRSIEVQIGYYIAVRLADEFPEQALARIGSWAPRIDGVEMLGVLRAINAALVVALALFAGSLYRRLSDRLRLYMGISIFTVGYMVWAVSNSGWLLIAAAVVLTFGEIAYTPVRQALLADLVDPAARTKYMAAYSLNARIGLVVGTVCVTVGAYVPPFGMALLYGSFGIGAALVLRSLLAARESVRAESDDVSMPPGADPTTATR